MQINSGSLITGSVGIPFITAYGFNETASWYPLSSSICRTAGVNNMMVNGQCQYHSNYFLNSMGVVVDNTLNTGYVFQDTAWTNIFGNLIPVDTAKSYSYSAWIKSAVSPQSWAFVGMACYDKNKLFIDISMLGGLGNTTLTAQLNVGDKTASIASSVGWSTTGDAYYFKDINFYPASDPDYYTPYTYTRIQTTYTTQSGNLLYLTTPWGGPTMPNGTPVSNGRAGSTYNYCLFYLVVPTVWTFVSTVCYDEGSENVDNNYSHFRYGTKYIGFLSLSNYGGNGNDFRYTNVVFGNMDDLNDNYTQSIKTVSVSNQNIVYESGINEIL